MHIHVVPNRGSPPTVLLRESYREGSKVGKRTLANLSSLSAAQIEAIRAALRGETLQPAAQGLEITASRSHGHVQATALTLQRLGLASVLAAKPCRERDLVLAMVASRIVAPHTKLATTRWWHTTTLAEDFGVADASEDDLYAAMDWLLARQDTIQKKLAARHLRAGGLVLYDLSSSYFEGTTCPLAKLGDSRDGRKGLLQVNYGLLTDARGCPVAVSVHEGNVADSQTLMPEVTRLREDFGIEQLVMVGDRGMISNQAIAAMRQAGTRHRLDYRAQERLDPRAHRARAICSWACSTSAIWSSSLTVLSGASGWARAAIRNSPGCAPTSARNCSAATQRHLDKIKARVGAASLPGATIGLRVGRVVTQYKVAKHFELAIGERAFTFQRKLDGIAVEAALDGVYIIRTSVNAAQMEAADCAPTTRRWPTSSARSARQ